MSSHNAEEHLASAYELARQARIKSNQAFLVSLGLAPGGAKLPLVPVAVVVATGNCKGASKGGSAGGTGAKGKPKRKNRPRAQAAAPTRASKRLRSEAPEKMDPEVALTEQEALLLREAREEEDRTWNEQRRERYMALHRLEEEKGLDNLPATATYKHTVMRVLSMSDLALETRIKRIENAQGQHCVIKMKQFAQVLIIERKHELALLAKEALQRLLDPSA